MDTIKSYLDNVFQALPGTEEIRRLKTELLGDMEAKYHELRQSGKTENEAIGIVIGEFGNIDELLDEMGMATVKHSDSPVLSMSVIRDFFALSAKASFLIGCGVAIILIGVASFIGLSGFIDGNNVVFSWSNSSADIFPVAWLLLMIIPAVALFIYSGTLLEGYKFIEEGDFTLDFSTESTLKEELSVFAPKRTISTIAGVCMCIFSVVLFLLISSFNENFALFGVCLMLLIIAAAVFIFIRIGSIEGAYAKLLKTGDYDAGAKRANKIIGIVSGFVWPLAVCVFLIWGLLYGGWGIAWIVFPITGIAFGGFAAVCNAIYSQK